MPTGKKITKFQNKQLITQQQWRNLRDYLAENGVEATRHVYNKTGVFVSTPGVDFAFSVDAFQFTPDPFESIDESGHVLTWDSAGYPAQTFENLAATDYQVGLHYASVPDGVEQNPRTLLPMYREDRDEVGEIGDADSVGTPSGSTAKIYFNTVITGQAAAPGTDHTGRPVTVMLKTPVSSNPNEAFQSGTVSHDASGNYFTWDTMDGTTPSIVAADYQVFIPGATIHKDGVDPDITASPADEEYVFIGKITGSGSPSTPTVSDTTGQNDLSVSLADVSSLFGVEHDTGDGSHTAITGDSGASSSFITIGPSARTEPLEGDIKIDRDMSGSNKAVISLGDSPGSASNWRVIADAALNELQFIEGASVVFKAQKSPGGLSITGRIINSGDITTTTGDVVSTAGDVVVSGSGRFIHSSDVSGVRTYSALHAIEVLPSSPIDAWEINNPTGTSLISKEFNSSAIQTAYLAIPVNLPSGSIIKEWWVHGELVSGGTYRATLFKSANGNFTFPTAKTAITAEQSTTSTSTFTLRQLLLSEVISSANDYFILINITHTAASTARFFGAGIQYDYASIKI